MKKISFLIITSLIIILQPSVYAKEKIDIEKALMQGHHEKLVKYYQEQAEEQRSIANLHTRMMNNYRGSHAYRNHSKMSKHCKRLRDYALKMADEYDNMAKDELAFEAKIKK